MQRAVHLGQHPKPQRFPRPDCAGWGMNIALGSLGVLKNSQQLSVFLWAGQGSAAA